MHRSTILRLTSNRLFSLIMKERLRRQREKQTVNDHNEEVRHPNEETDPSARTDKLVLPRWKRGSTWRKNTYGWDSLFSQRPVLPSSSPSSVRDRIIQGLQFRGMYEEEGHSGRLHDYMWDLG